MGVYGFRWNYLVWPVRDYRLTEFIGFIRLKVCLVITNIAAVGYLLFNPLSTGMILPLGSAYFLTTALYCYNMITDKDEDLLNHKKVNYFVYHKGLGFTRMFYIIGGFFTLYLPASTTIIYIILAALGSAYSRYRIKGYFPFKNLYTGFVVGSIFLLGVAAGPAPLEPGRVLGYLGLLVIHLMAISLISDLRDYNGDMASGILTVPVVIGTKRASGIAFLFLITFGISVLLTGQVGFYPLVPFIVPTILFLKKNDPYHSHLSSLVSYMIWPVAVLAL